MKVDSWLQQPDEPDGAYRAFKAYRNLPSRERSVLAAFRQETGRPDAAEPPGQWTGWAAQHGWVRRARSWDAEMERVQREAHLAEVAELGRRHARIARGMLDKAVQRLNAIDPAELSPSELVRFIDYGVKIEQLALSKPTQINREEVVTPEAIRETAQAWAWAAGGDIDVDELTKIALEIADARARYLEEQDRGGRNGSGPRG